MVHFRVVSIIFFARGFPPRQKSAVTRKNTKTERKGKTKDKKKRKTKRERWQWRREAIEWTTAATAAGTVPVTDGRALNRGRRFSGERGRRHGGREHDHDRRDDRD